MSRAWRKGFWFGLTHPFRSATPSEARARLHDEKYAALLAQQIANQEKILALSNEALDAFRLDEL